MLSFVNPPDTIVDLSGSVGPGGAKAPALLTHFLTRGLLSLATPEEPEDKGTAHEEKSEDNADNCAGPAGEAAATTAAGWDSGRGDVVVRAVVGVISFDRTGI